MLIDHGKLERVNFKESSMIVLTCPNCLKERKVSSDQGQILCRSCGAKERIKKFKIPNKGIDISGQQFNKLKVVSFAHINKSGEYQWNCLCSCGKETIVSGRNLRSRKTNSCGCTHKTMNGQSHTFTGVSYASIVTRCYNEKALSFKMYGAKGVTICNRWRESYLNFLEDMGERPFGTSLDRIDNSKGYFKENCRWATPKEQACNQSSNRTLSAFGKSQCVSLWEKETGIKSSTIRSRLKYGWSIEDSLSIPLRNKKKPTNG